MGRKGFREGGKGYLRVWKRFNWRERDLSKEKREFEEEKEDLKGVNVGKGLKGKEDQRKDRKG